MARHFSLSTVLIAMTLAGCVANLGGDPLDTSDPTSSAFALVASTGESDRLRRGESLQLQIGDLAELDPETIYRFEVVGPGGGILSDGDVRTDRDGRVYVATIMHDVGEDERVMPGQRLAVSLRDGLDSLIATTAIDLVGVPALQRPGFNVDEPEPPHIFAANALGEPTNAFAVGGVAEGEPVGPVHIAGDGFPESVAGREVDVYVARDRDEWRGSAIPHEGDEAWIAGPIAVAVSADGVMAPTPIFDPGLGHVGIYDILVDVDRDGSFEWSFDSKDGADGINRVGFTIQYSQAWLAARESSHILVNIAYNSHHRDGGEWQNDFSADESVFMYLNPPVMHQYHFHVTKWIVRHQDFDAFWNNPAMADENGAVHFAQFAVTNMDGPPQDGCTNTAPTCYGVVPIGEETNEESFDVVFDRNGNGYYEIGEDLLDIVSGDVGGDIVTIERFRGLLPEQQRGFIVRRD